MENRKQIIAPTDPKFKGKYFYLYRDIKFEAFMRPSGKRTCENYLDSGRIISAVKINGGIEDEAILKLFETAQGTQELIKGVGVELSADIPDSVFDFGIVYYGKSDKYNSGTHILRQITANGVEEYIDFSEIDFSEDDDILGQLEIEFPDNLDVAAMSVKIYVDEKYDIPLPEDDEQVDITSRAYISMIKKSLCSIGNNERFLKAVKKAEAGKDITIAFIGGSITQGAGGVPSSTECYAYKTYQGFKRLIEEKSGIKNAKNLHYIRAGIGGTPSELGVVRYDKDVTDFGRIMPDIVVVEFAVNDAGDETDGDCYEGLMRKIWFSENKPALILLFAVFADDFNLQERFIPIGEKYGVPMISVKNAVSPQFSSSQAEGRIISRRQYFYDIFHPSNIGHTIMADCLINYFNEALKKAETKDIDNPPVVRSDDFQSVIYFDKKYKGLECYVNYSKAQSINVGNDKRDAACISGAGSITILPGSFSLTDKNLQEVERNFDNFATPCFPDNWMHEPGKNEPLKVTLCCRIFMIIFKDTSDTGFGTFDIKADGKFVKSYDPKEIGWVHSNAIIVIREKEANTHKIEISMSDGDIDKFGTVLGFGYV